MTNTTQSEMTRCPKCGKPYTYVGDIPEGGFGKGNAPYCEGHEPEHSLFGNYGWICPVCGRGLSPYTSQCPCRGFDMYKIICQQP